MRSAGRHLVHFGLRRAGRRYRQAASLEETTAALNQVTGIVKSTAAGASEVHKAMAQAHQEASAGGAVVQDAIGAMAAIERSASAITQIINVIDGIAFQTNLLALNAGVEAARAGDAGKGFAVVASEVRVLAQRSADAAKDIKELINTSTLQVAGGVKLVHETGELLETIVARVGEISDQVSQIATSAMSQAVSLQQVNGAVHAMDRMTQQNAAMVEQSTAAARSLADEAKDLTSTISHFRMASAKTSKTDARPPRSHAAERPMHAMHGNLALKSATSAEADDWAEF